VAYRTTNIPFFEVLSCLQISSHLSVSLRMPATSVLTESEQQIVVRRGRSSNGGQAQMLSNVLLLYTNASDPTVAADVTRAAPRANLTTRQYNAPMGAAGWRIVFLASLGGALEFYDFVVFGIFAKDIADAIFPSPTPLISLMVSFAAFAAGYVARPVGGIVLSHFGDRYGRRRVFLISIFVMSGATLGMGLVPPFARWGVLASVLMVTLRLVQGFCLGGEIPGALTYVVEAAPQQAPFVCGLVFTWVTLGVAAATGVSLAVRTWLPMALVARLGWRVAFVLGGLGGLSSFVLRRSLEESPEFARMKQLASRQPFRELLRSHLVPVAVGISMLAATAGFNGLYFAHMAAYMSGVLGYDPRQAVVSQTAGVVIHALGILAVGWLADRVHPRLLLRAGSLALVALAFPFYTALASRSMNPTVLLMLAGVCASFVNGTFAVLLTDLFPTRVRFSGVALGFNVAFTIFSGTAPLVATSLIRATGLDTAPAFIMVGCGLVTVAGSLGLSQAGGHVLRAQSAEMSAIRGQQR
jgi:MHS family proline/betaine transporter-like MFS transporter